jgi:hypothetical protein
MKLTLKPRKVPALFAAALGFAGFFLGVPGLVIGALLGYLLGCVFSQIQSDQVIYRYFENPGLSSFDEGEPGLAAFSALGAYLASKSSPALLSDEAAALRVAAGAVSAFSQGKKIASLSEMFARLALARLSLLNPDLLAESLAARRKDSGDSALMGACLAGMAVGKEAEREALYVRQFLEPGYEPPDARDDPWTVLGIAKGASYDEVKSVFRQLALMFHPDNQNGLNDDEREKMGETFIKIRDAYRTITREIIH